MSNIKFFRDNVDFYSEEYRDYSLKPWEQKIVELVSGPNVLDVACGGGRITVPLLRRGHNVVGVDFVEEFERKIRKHESEFKGKFKFDEGDMTNLPYPDCSFDSLTCINSLVYLRNAEEVCEAIKEMGRVLKPSGKLFITTWNLLHPLWGVSVVLNYLLRRGSKFGETSPFWATDSRINNSRTTMFVPSGKKIKQICNDAGLSVSVHTGRGFVNGKSLLAMFHPFLVITGSKE